MVKIGAELPKSSQKIKLGIRFLDHPVRVGLLHEKTTAAVGMEIPMGIGWVWELC